MACTERALAAALMALALAAPGLAQQAQPNPPAQVEAGDAGRLAALSEGLRETLGRARDAFAAGERLEAVTAVDAAHRLAKVAAHVAPPEAYEAAAMAEHHILRVRGAVQNGRPEEEILRRVEAALDAAERIRGPGLRRPARLKPYAGATLIALSGEKLGEIEAIDARQATATPSLWEDTLGFLDLGGGEASAPVNRLIFGPTGTLGRIFVVLADPEVRTPEDLEGW
jgi:hypothetical protein